MSGGSLHPDPREVIETGWFGLDNLPEPILPWMVQEIQDVLRGVGGSAVWRQELNWAFPPDLSRNDLYHLRDESGLSRQDFYLKHATLETFEKINEISPTLGGKK